MKIQEVKGANHKSKIREALKVLGNKFKKGKSK